MQRKGWVMAAGFAAALAVVNVVMVPGLKAADPVAEEERQVTGRFLLETHDGQRVTADSFEGSLRLMAFGYTFCPDVCPTALSVMAAALDELGPDAEQVIPMFVTVDPERDTKERLKDYVGSFGPRFIGLTGNRAMIDGAARQFKVSYTIHPPAPGDDPDIYVVDHSAGIYIMGRDGQFLARLSHTASARDVSDRIRQILARGG